MSEIVSARQRKDPESAQENEIRQWIAAQESRSIDNLEAGGREIVQLVTVLIGLVFAAINLGSDDLEAGLSLPLVVVTGFAAMLLLLAALGAALWVIFPFPSHYRPSSLTDQKALYARLLQRKAVALMLALICFGLGMVAFVVVIFTLLGYR